MQETQEMYKTGQLPKGVYARDLILTIIGQIGANGANYKAMEFGGEGLKTLSMSDRIAICNLCVEAGAKTALMEVDENTVEQAIIQYINKNLHKELNLQLLCDKFFISRAQLCRRFQKATGTSVGKYIKVKRLLACHQLIQEGEKPTRVYSASWAVLLPGLWPNWRV